MNLTQLLAIPAHLRISPPCHWLLLFCFRTTLSNVTISRRSSIFPRVFFFFFGNSSSLRLYRSICKILFLSYSSFISLWFFTVFVLDLREHKLLPGRQAVLDREGLGRLGPITCFIKPLRLTTEQTSSFKAHESTDIIEPFAELSLNEV